MGNTAKVLRHALALCAMASLAACSDESPPTPSVQEFIDDPILLDATMVRCVANRDSLSHDPQCVNARAAVERMGAAKEQARRAALEAEFERKRAALRRARDVADEARMQAAETARHEDAVRPELAPHDEAAESQELAPIEVEDGGGIARVTVQDVPVDVQKSAEAASGEPSRAGAEDPAATTDLSEIREELEQRRDIPVSH